MSEPDQPNSTWVRVPFHDRRIAYGDDFSADAWRCVETGDVRHVAVGTEPSEMRTWQEGCDDV